MADDKEKGKKKKKEPNPYEKAANEHRPGEDVGRIGVGSGGNIKPQE